MSSSVNEVIGLITLDFGKNKLLGNVVATNEAGQIKKRHGWADQVLLPWFDL